MTATIPFQYQRSDDPLASWELVQRAQAGDQDAKADIYRRYHDMVVRFIYHRVSSRPLAEDFAADTFVRALATIDRFTFQGRDFGAWLVTIARNLVADYYKSARYRLMVQVDPSHAHSAPLGGLPEPEEPDPAVTVGDYLRNRDLWTAVKQLTDDQRDCIILRYLHGLSIAETAQAMGKDEGAVKALAFRGTQSLRRILRNKLAVVG